MSDEPELRLDTSVFFDAEEGMWVLDGSVTKDGALFGRHRVASYGPFEGDAAEQLKRANSGLRPSFDNWMFEFLRFKRELGDK